MIQYDKNGQEITINMRRIPLPAPIWNVKEFKNLVIVTVDPDYSNTNISAYDLFGNLVWVIEKRPFEYPQANRTKGYNGILVRNEELIAWSYINFVVDEHDGKIIRELPFSK